MMDEDYGKKFAAFYDDFQKKRPHLFEFHKCAIMPLKSKAFEQDYPEIFELAKKFHKDHMPINLKSVMYYTSDWQKWYVRMSRNDILELIKSDEPPLTEPPEPRKIKTVSNGITIMK